MKLYNDFVRLLFDEENNLYEKYLPEEKM